MMNRFNQPKAFQTHFEQLKNMLLEVDESSTVDKLENISARGEITSQTLRALLIPIFRKLEQEKLEQENRNQNQETESLAGFPFHITSEDLPPPRGYSLPSHGLEITVICNNLKSAHNVGSIIRVCDCIGARRLILIGYSPMPTLASVSKVSMGAEKNIEIQHSEFFEEAVQLLEKDTVLIGLETTNNSSSLPQVVDAVLKTQKVALLVGNETHGLSASDLMKCDHVFRLSTYGTKNSLNVATCLSAAAYLVIEMTNAAVTPKTEDQK